MRPQFALRIDIGESAADLVNEFNKTSALSTWGWASRYISEVSLCQYGINNRYDCVKEKSDLVSG